MRHQSIQDEWIKSDYTLYHPEASKINILKGIRKLQFASILGCNVLSATNACDYHDGTLARASYFASCYPVTHCQNLTTEPRGNLKDQRGLNIEVLSSLCFLIV